MKKITVAQINRTFAALEKKGGNVIRRLMDIFKKEQPALLDYTRDGDENLNADERELLITAAVMGWHIIREAGGSRDEIDDNSIDERYAANLDLFNDTLDGDARGSMMDLLALGNDQRALMNFLTGLMVNRPSSFTGDIRDDALVPMILHLKTVVDCLVLGPCKIGEYSEEDFEAAKNTINGMLAPYRNSRFYKKLSKTEKEEAEFIITGFGEVMYNYFLQKPAEWTLSAALKCCVDIMPRKFMVEDSFFAAMEPVLKSFMLFGADTGDIPGGIAIARGLTGIGSTVMEKANDPESWGPGKAMLKGAADSGVNVSDKKELEAFIKKHNREQEKNRVIEFPGGQKKPGRNDPCPCGSGKKYKKCCGKE